MRPALFWTIATIMVALTNAAILIPLLWKRGDAAPEKANRRTIAVAVTTSTLLPLAALAIYSTFGAPQLVGSPPAPAPDSVVAQHAAGAMANGTEGGDLAAAVQRLKAKLAANPQDAAGWTLLAQSYDFAGNSALANEARANAQKIAAGQTVSAPEVDATNLTDAAVAAMMTPQSAAVAAAPASLADKAEMHRRKREFPQALAIFAELAKTPAMTADLWADYADAHGAAQGKLDRVSAGYIAKALALDPKHVKALWLLGSYQTEQGDNRGALSTWQALATLLPRDSSDYRIISANLAEARAQLQQPAASAGRTAAVRGTVDIDARFRKSVPNGSILFVFAKEANAAGPPLAVMRITVTGWPVKFLLDDSLAMMPTRKLSQFSNVVVEARISRNGNAQASAGDLRTTSKTVDPRSSTDLKLIINDEIT